MLVVGITGGIGSGKTSVTNRLAELGVEIIDADTVAREVVEPGSDCLRAIAARFGPQILMADGHLNRRALREIVFQNPEEKSWLESVTHPAVRSRILEKLNQARGDYVVLVSPLLFETGQDALTDFTVTVDLPEPLQEARAGRRDGQTAADIRAIIASQMPRTQRRAQADFVLDNSGTPEDLLEATDQLHRQLLVRAETLPR